ncbi:MAG TPA: complex I subunit 5 family protein [Gaiellaceae bacterium]|nr:complex I subunit 5 family protein [Gaiellaceae bacterium]
MSWLLPLPVAIPLLTAAAIVATESLLPRRVLDAVALAAAAAATAFSLLIMLHAEAGDVLHWFGGWRPSGGVAIGIDFAADPLGAGLAALACGLVTLALLYSWSYMQEAARLFDALMLVFCGAMAGFALTGDLFNMFVWFELMGVAAYALAGFKVEELGPLQGAVNFAITNTAGAYLILIGIGLLYARTGALNLAQLGRMLAGHPADRLVIVALTLVFVGFLVKAAIVPFHWWLADAHAVAPAPVCVLFSGAMVEMGIYAVARIYWTVFSSPLGHAGEVRSLLVWIGVVTALVGALMCFLQRHLKRMLAFSTITHAGVMLVGVGLLDPKALAGAANLVLSHGFVKGGLFMVCGAVLVRLRAVDELRLHGAGRAVPWWGVLWAAGAVGLIGVPYVGVFLGHALVDDGATARGIAWVQPLLMIAEAVSGGALLRAGARVFLGWGAKDDSLLTPEPPEEPPERDAAVAPMAVAATIAIVIGLALSVTPGLEVRTEHAAERFVDRTAYVAHVLRDAKPAREPRPPFTVRAATTESWAYGLAALALAALTAAFGLWRHRLPELFRAAAGRALRPPVEVLRSAHSGIVGDYLLWLTIGTAVIGGVWAFTLR